MSMTREKAIQWMQTEKASFERAPSLNGCPMTKDWQDAIDVYRLAIDALREQEENRWIPVTERLPDEELWEYQKKYDQDNMEVLVMIKGAKEATTLYYDNEGDFIDENDDAWLVTHWMPLPEAPKEVE